MTGAGNEGEGDGAAMMLKSDVDIDSAECATAGLAALSDVVSAESAIGCGGGSVGSSAVMNGDDAGATGGRGDDGSVRVVGGSASAMLIRVGVESASASTAADSSFI